MLRSIKWRFVAIYFTLVFIAMIIVGIFIVNRLETTQIESMEEDMIYTASSMLSSSEDLTNSNWIENRKEVQNILEEWKVNSNYQLYAIYDENIPTVIASVNVNSPVVGERALGYKVIDPEMLLNAFGGDKTKRTIESPNDERNEIHLSYPVIDSDGNVNGVFYIVGNLSSVYSLIEDSKGIFINATLLALLITVALGFWLANSITVPISDLTKKISYMALGNFEQKVEVKSNDEIGQLASMFNTLTGKLSETLATMDIERAKLDTIFNYMAEGVIAIDTDNRLIHANQIASEILKLNPEDIYGRQVQQLEKLNISGVDYSDVKSLEGISSIAIEDRYYNVIYGPFLDDTKRPSGIIIVFQDITKEHKLDEMRKDFVANVSHELKTPITTIKTYTETLMDGDVDMETTQNFLEIIDREADRMTRLVKDLLQLSNIDYDSNSFNYAEIHVNNFLKSCLASLELMREEKKIIVEIKNFKNDLYIISDRDALEKIIMNIISNAYKYTENYGKLIIEILEQKDTIKLSFKDNGIGIPYKDQRHIFERFYRVEKARSRQAGGTGLGLSISRELVEAMGGSILLKSKPNIGTEIIITLPKGPEGELI